MLLSVAAFVVVLSLRVQLICKCVDAEVTDLTSCNFHVTMNSQAEELCVLSWQTTFSEQDDSKTIFICSAKLRG